MEEHPQEVVGAEHQTEEEEHSPREIMGSVELGWRVPGGPHGVTAHEGICSRCLRTPKALYAAYCACAWCNSICCCCTITLTFACSILTTSKRSSVSTFARATCPSSGPLTTNQMIMFEGSSATYVICMCIGSSDSRPVSWSTKPDPIPFICTRVDVSC